MQTAAIMLSAAFCLAWLLLMARIWRAYRLRISIMREDLDLYFRLPSLGVMVFKFWRPLSSFIEEAKRDDSGGKHLPPQTKQTE